jgi:hypothetical protein
LRRVGYSPTDDVRALREKLTQPLRLAQEYEGEAAADKAIVAINKALELSLEFEQRAE